METWEDLPQLVDVPVVFPRAGGYVLTMPIKPGDECLVIFGDNCMDAWWQSGGVQNQIDCRRHDLSDGYCIPGPWSQPRTIPNYSTSSAQLRTESGSSYIELAGNDINIVAAGNIKIKGARIDINEPRGISMSKATRIGDLNTGHDSCPPVALVTGSRMFLLTDGRRGV